MAIYSKPKPLDKGISGFKPLPSGFLVSCIIWDDQQLFSVKLGEPAVETWEKSIKNYRAILKKLWK